MQGRLALVEGTGGDVSPECLIGEYGDREAAETVESVFLGG